MIDAFYQRWPEMIAGDIEGTVAILRELKEAGTPLYALTNWSYETFPVALKRFEFLSWFQGIVVSGEEKLIKPDPQIYRLLLARHGVRAEDIVYVDDSPPNVEVATILGMHGIRSSARQHYEHEADRARFSARCHQTDLIDPCHALGMLFVVWISDRFKEVAVAPGTADVLPVGNVRSLRLDQAWICNSGDRVGDAFDADAVFPAVAEIVEVLERPDPGVLQDIDEAYLARIEWPVAEVRAHRLIPELSDQNP